MTTGGIRWYQIDQAGIREVKNDAEIGVQEIEIGVRWYKVCARVELGFSVFKLDA